MSEKSPVAQFFDGLLKTADQRGQATGGLDASNNTTACTIDPVRYTHAPTSPGYGTVDTTLPGPPPRLSYRGFARAILDALAQIIQDGSNDPAVRLEAINLYLVKGIELASEVSR